jgi:pimeloyl-ACP methyl ester carboxylesterase/predicted ester cyclase
LCDERVFAPLQTALDGRELVVVDMLGVSDVGALAQRVLAAAPQQFAMLGFSLGGIVALEVATRAPDRVAGLGLIASNARAVPEEARAARRAAIAEIESAARHVEETLWPSYVAAGRVDDRELKARIVAMANELPVGTLAAQVEVALSRSEKLSHLGKIRAPSLVLGGAQDGTCTPDMQREMAAALPDATLEIVPDAGHFVLLEAPDAAAAHVKSWLARVDAASDTRQHNTFDPGENMADMAGKIPEAKAAKITDDPKDVLQVERRDFTQLVPTDRPRVQSMRGFDDCYTDIVDYIIRCTHKIWDERDIGLIYSHYTHNCVVYGVLGTMYDRETIVRETIQRCVELPDRRGMATQVVWRGNDVDGFYTSHMTHGMGRHTEYGAWGRPTGRSFVTRTVADCMILENKIYKEWVIRDNMALFTQLGLDVNERASELARYKFDHGETMFELSENRRLLGQYPPETKADLSLAHDDGEAEVLEWLHHIYNQRMFGKIHEIYAPTVQWHGPLMRELYGVAAVLQQTMRLVALIPDGAFVPQHICSVESEEGGRKYAVRWNLTGHHLGYGALGAPTGYPLFVMGVTHFHVIDGKIVDEWVLYDEFSMLVQIKLAALQAEAA